MQDDMELRPLKGAGNNVNSSMPPATYYGNEDTYQSEPNNCHDFYRREQALRHWRAISNYDAFFSKVSDAGWRGLSNSFL